MARGHPVLPSSFVPDAPNGIVGAVTFQPPSGGPVLVDPAKEAALQRDGFVVVDVVPPEVAASMRAEFGALHGWERQQLIDVQAPDFEIAMWDPDLGYRHAIDALVDAAARPAVEAQFSRHRVIGRTMMVKWPAVPGTPAFDGVPDQHHNDSTYVDERTGARSWEAWLALQHIDESNGCVWVVPHSHRLPRTLRGWGVDASYLSHAEVFRAREVPVVLGPGQAMVFDPALVHRSGPNRTEEARVAVMILLADPSEPLCIFRRRDEAHAERVALPPGFFSDGRYEELGSEPAAEVVALDLPQLSEAEAGQLLDELAAQAPLG